MARHFACLVPLLLMLLPAAASAEEPEAVDPEAEVTFERDVRPILKAHCVECHGVGDEREGGLDLRLRRFMVDGGESGPAIVPGEPGESYLLERVRKGEMPPENAPKLTDEQVETIRRWIALGAKTARPEPEELGEGMRITQVEREHWAFQPIERPEVPDFEGHPRVRTPIDAFLLKRMKERSAGLSFSEDADRRTLMRRAALDLLGVPPRPRALDRFAEEDRPGAYRRLIDRLLASPRYGERWGRHWLDVAGYADSEGYSDDDSPRKWAYKYRDYVIESFNKNKPFDRFITEQLAGDELAGPKEGDWTEEQIELLTATGFLRMAPDGTGDSVDDRKEARNQVIAETIKIVSSSMMGLTVGCAQCHDHKYDPIPQEDYYRMRAILAPAYDWQNWRRPSRRRVSLYTQADREEAKRIEQKAQEVAAERKKKQEKFLQEAFEKEVKKKPEELREPLREAYNTPKNERTDEQKQLLKEHPNVNITPGVLYQYNRDAADKLEEYSNRIKEIRAKKPKEEFVRALTERPGHVPETYLFHRGDYRQPKHEVEPGGLTITAPPGERRTFPENAEDLPTTGRRLAFARWLTGGEHPLVARVIVNRVWMHHFGKALVSTPGDFGMQGAEPIHPELLDWLAAEFMAGGWDLKELHRLIMRSTVYRQSSVRDPAMAEIDSENRLYWRKPLQRLEAEAIRDSMLAVAGVLNTDMGGPPLPIATDEVGQVVIGRDKTTQAGRNIKIESLGGDEYRRSLYIQVRRSQPVDLLKTFDAPVMRSGNCTRRRHSTAAPQALMLMNSQPVLEHAESFAERLQREAGDAPDAKIRRAWKLAFGRPPTGRELDESRSFLEKQRELMSGEDYQQRVEEVDPRRQALINFCQSLLSANEFLYVD